MDRPYLHTTALSADKAPAGAQGERMSKEMSSPKPSPAAKKTTVAKLLAFKLPASSDPEVLEARGALKDLMSDALRLGSVSSEALAAILTVAGASDEQAEKLWLRLDEAGIELLTGADDEDEEPGVEEPVVEELAGAGLDLEADEVSSLPDAFTLHLREMSQFKLLTPEQEKSLGRKKAAWVQMREHQRKPDQFPPPQVSAHELQASKEAFEQMFLSNLRLVVHRAKRHRRHGLPMPDLVQEGYVGLMRAVEKFDPELGFRFSTYAVNWIDQAMTRGTAEQAHSIRVPVHVHELLNRMNASMRRLNQELGREPTDEEIAEAMSRPERKPVSVQTVKKLKGIQRDTVSLDRPAGEDGESEMGDFITAADTDRPFNQTMERLKSQEITALLGPLPERDRLVVMLRYGIDVPEPYKLEEIGQKFGITRERVRQIISRALHYLRSAPGAQSLRSYLDDMDAAD